MSKKEQQIMEQENFVIEEELKKLPGKPGVYLMHGQRDEIIYVGKAVSLKNRVRQYFQAGYNRSAKIQKMVSLITRFEYIITDSEMEALVLECNLIKEHRPKYNTMLKDDKGYPYIKVTLEEDYPRLIYSHQMRKDKSRYFGPYTNAGAVKDILDVLNKFYQLRTCNRVLPRDEGKERPCLNYHIKQCQAPCQGYISVEAYGEKVKKAVRFLEGHYGEIREELKAKMYEASEKMEFEEAITYRELLESVKQIAERQKITNTGSVEDRDILAFALDGVDAVMQVFFVREGKLIGRDHYHVKVAEGDTPEQIMTSFVKQFYAGTPYVPGELLLQVSLLPEEAEMVSKWLSARKGRKVSVHTPKKGEKEKLVELAARNAQMVLSQDRERLKREEMRTIGAVKEIGDLLGLSGIARMEAFDISNTSGFESVGSMVVYENGKPKRNDYRRFKIKTVIGPNDYASMEEVLTRRFRHGQEELETLKEKGMAADFGSFTRFPDLILMDGGKGQVHIAEGVLEKFGLNIPVCGMVKDDRHRTRGLYYQDREIPIDRHSEGFHLITRIQDEAHRFAIEFHRNLRSDAQVKSVLDDIPGIGPKRRKALMKAFGSAEAVSKAGEEQLRQTEGLDSRSAASVYRFFHPEED